MKQGWVEHHTSLHRVWHCLKIMVSMLSFFFFYLFLHNLVEFLNRTAVSHFNQSKM